MNTAKDRLEELLKFAADRRLSDIHLKADQPPLFRRVGHLISRKDSQLYDGHTLTQMVDVVLTKERLQRFLAGHDITTTYSIVGVGRFRVHVYRQRGLPAIAVRALPATARGLAALQLPQHFANWVLNPSGLVLVCSSAGHGRSSTLAGLVDAINTQSTGPRHMATVESPINVYHDDKLAWISQREVGVDCASFASGILGAARQDTDVIAVDDPSDSAAWEAALAAAESGKLVIASLRSARVVTGLRQLISTSKVSPERLAGVFGGICATHLFATADGKRCIPAVEFLAPTPTVTALIREGKDYARVAEQMVAPTGQSFEQHVQALLSNGLISADSARRFASFRLG
ncbi:MAG TPA: hypothetical protein DCQ06_13400 [Myxococcales bacterium]|nr:hypothetical protein [Myxococcales bacterium]HAN32586.1 hypothetical protein [Myxococcales bacterium]